MMADKVAPKFRTKKRKSLNTEGPKQKKKSQRGSGNCKIDSNHQDASNIVNDETRNPDLALNKIQLDVPVDSLVDKANAETEDEITNTQQNERRQTENENEDPLFGLYEPHNEDDDNASSVINEEEIFDENKEENAQKVDKRGELCDNENNQEEKAIQEENAESTDVLGSQVGHYSKVVEAEIDENVGVPREKEKGENTNSNVDGCKRTETPREELEFVNVPEAYATEKVSLEIEKVSLNTEKTRLNLDNASLNTEKVSSNIEKTALDIDRANLLVQNAENMEGSTSDLYVIVISNDTDGEKHCTRDKGEQENKETLIYGASEDDDVEKKIKDGKPPCSNEDVIIEVKEVEVVASNRDEEDAESIVPCDNKEIQYGDCTSGEEKIEVIGSKDLTISLGDEQNDKDSNTDLYIQHTQKFNVFGDKDSQESQTRREHIEMTISTDEKNIRDENDFVRSDKESPTLALLLGTQSLDIDLTKQSSQMTQDIATGELILNKIEGNIQKKSTEVTTIPCEIPNMPDAEHHEQESGTQKDIICEDISLIKLNEKDELGIEQHMKKQEKENGQDEKESQLVEEHGVEIQKVLTCHKEEEGVEDVEVQAVDVPVKEEQKEETHAIQNLEKQDNEQVIVKIENEHRIETQKNEQGVEKESIEIKEQDGTEEKEGVESTVNEESYQMEITDSQLLDLDWTSVFSQRTSELEASKDSSRPPLPDGTNIVKGIIKELSMLNMMILKNKREYESEKRRQNQLLRQQRTAMPQNLWNFR